MIGRARRRLSEALEALMAVEQRRFEERLGDISARERLARRTPLASRREHMTLESMQGALRRAIEAAETLGLEIAEAQAVARTIEERQGYPSDLYVLGLAGGTGVGKSSLLNAIAGADISRSRRPPSHDQVAGGPAALRLPGRSRSVARVAGRGGDQDMGR